MYAVYGDYKTCVQELLNNNADITAENSNLDTAYSIAVKRNFHSGNVCVSIGLEILLIKCLI